MAGIGSAWVKRFTAATAIAAAMLGIAATAEARVVAENGFTAEESGFSFENYASGAEAPGSNIKDLNASGMRKLFGRRVCIGGKKSSGRCTLTPEAEAWREATNSSMGGGHCYGMATSAQLWFEGTGRPPTPERFGSETTPGLELVGNPPLQNHIAYMWTLQTLPSVARTATEATPLGVFKKLKRGLTPGTAPYVLVIFDDGGHAITPIAAESLGDGRRRIAVYDNNWPGETRYVEIDAKDNTWSYEIVPGEVWTGDAKTKSLGLQQPAKGLGHQPCFICPAKGDARTPGKSVELRLIADERSGRHGSISVTDQRGRESGCGPNGCVNEIRGAKLRQVVTGAPPWKTEAPPVLQLPTRNSYRVELGATSKRARVKEGVRILGRGFSFGATDVAIGKSDTDVIKIRRDVRSVAYKNDARGVESPHLVMSTSNVDGGPDYEIKVKPQGINRGAGLGVRFDPREEKLRLVNRGGSKVERAKVRIIKYNRSGTSILIDQPVEIKRGKGGTIKFG